VASEIWAVYGLETVTIPPNRPCLREVLPPVCCVSEPDKWHKVVAAVREASAVGRPVLIGTRSVEASANLSAALEAAGIAHRVLSARQDAEEAEVIATAGNRGAVTVATNMAGRGTDIRLGPGVAELGGLFVILTEYHDSPRIDRQLIGRCARQGDPGGTVAIVSLEDALFHQQGGLVLEVLRRCFPDGLAPFWLDRLRARAQGAAEAIHARTRRDTLKQDRELDRMLGFAGRQV
jgi:preprotein translocase subunit SecA